MLFRVATPMAEMEDRAILSKESVHYSNQKTTHASAVAEQLRGFAEMPIDAVAASATLFSAASSFCNCSAKFLSTAICFLSYRFQLPHTHSLRMNCISCVRVTAEVLLSSTIREVKR